MSTPFQVLKEKYEISFSDVALLLGMEETELQMYQFDLREIHPLGMLLELMAEMPNALTSVVARRSAIRFKNRESAKTFLTIVQKLSFMHPLSKGYIEIIVMQNNPQFTPEDLGLRAICIPRQD